MTLGVAERSQPLPGIPLLLLASSAIGGTVVSWFRNRSHALLTQEIERRERVESDLRGAQSHLESILNATSDGILDVRLTPEGPRISFANRRSSASLPHPCHCHHITASEPIRSAGPPETAGRLPLRFGVLQKLVSRPWCERSSGV